MIVKKLEGGSMADTYLISDNDMFMVKKEVLNCGELGVSKLKKQYEWIMELEDDIRFNFPKIYDYEFNNDYGQYTMEFLNLKSLRDQLIDKTTLTENDKELLNKVLINCEKISSKKIKCNNGKQYILDKHFNKMSERCNMVEDEHFKYILNLDSLIINGKKNKNLKDVLSELENYIEFLSPEYMNRSHGDYTFQNIMSDEKDIKIIDPRGEGYDPVYYDISKIYQSCHGKYDLMIKGNYNCKFENDHISYEFKKGVKLFNEIYNYINIKINDYFKLNKNWDIISRFYEGSHFISMVPFRYKESLENTVLAYAIGIEILNQVLNELKEVKNVEFK